jgi:hypothetical protein
MERERPEREPAQPTGDPGEPTYVDMVQLRVTGKLGSLIESLGSQLSDAAFVVDALTRRAAQEDDADGTAAFAFWSAALVAYGRIFTTGRRDRLDDSFLQETPYEEAHRRLLDLRNRHIAHRVFADAQGEQVLVIALLTALELEPKSVVGLGPAVLTAIGRSGEPAEAEIAAARFVHDEIQRQLAEAVANCMESLDAVPIEELYQRALTRQPWPVDG